MGAEALEACLKRAGAELSDLRHLCCVTSTGFLTPGLSAQLIRELGIDRHCSRSDIVGMGCNAGLNALNEVTGWAAAHPGELAVVLCSEACSAAYAMDDTMRAAVVNSLFGDGSGAVALTADTGPGDEAAVAPEGPRILKFASCLIPDAIDAMRYDWDRAGSAYSSTRRSRTWWARTPNSSSTGCCPGPDCAGATSSTGWCTPEARR